MPNKGFKHSEESKLKMGIANLGKIPWNKGTKGIIHHTEETKLKIGLAQLGEKNWNWTGGRSKDSNGYITILKKDHPYHNTRGRVYEHRFVMEEFLGRYLLPLETVHHINEIRDDNRIENLMLFNNISEHIKYEGSLHNYLRRLSLDS